MSSVIKIERVQENNLDELTSLLHGTKLALSINKLIIKDWPNDRVQQRLYRGAVEGALHTELIEDWNAIDQESGDIVGYIAHTIQESKDKGDSAPESIKEQVPEGIVPEVHEAVTQATNVITQATPNVRRIGKT